MKFVEKCGEPLYTLLSIFLWKVCTIFTSVFGKTSKELWKKYAIIGAIIGIDIDIDTRKSIDTYQYFPVSLSIDKYRYFSHHYHIECVRRFLFYTTSPV